MKHPLLFLLYFILGYISNGSHSYQQDIGQPKSVKVSKERYFFVGYAINNGTQNCQGNCQWFTYDGLLPVKKEVYKYLANDIHMEFSFDQLVIVGLYEFKNKTESDFFFHIQKEKP